MLISQPDFRVEFINMRKRTSCSHFKSICIVKHAFITCRMIYSIDGVKYNVFIQILLENL
jgi:hypothetical protein